jgi:hypothetical protein
MKDDDGTTRKWKDKKLCQMIPLNSVDARIFGDADDASEKNEFYYAWHLQQSSTRQTVMIAGLIVVVIVACLFQLWPLWARTIVWYISVTILLFILGTILVSFFLFALVWPFGWDFWLLPNFTSDTAPIWDLFSPIYTLEKSAGSHPAARFTIILAFVAAGVFVLRLPPSDFNDFMTSQLKIVDDLYSGALLTDGGEGAGGLTTQGRYNNPLNPFGNKWGPGSGRYGSMRAAPIPKLDELEKSMDLDTPEAAPEGEKTSESGGTAAESEISPEADIPPSENSGSE